MSPVGAVRNRTASAQLETAPTQHRERKCLFIFIIHHSTPKLGLLLLLCGGLIWNGCSAVIPQSNYIWSENYALDTNGGYCSSPEMNDGNLKTFGKLGLHAIGQRDSTITRKNGDGAVD